MKGADKLILATDPDREGEAISWHVLEVLKEKNALKAHDGRAGGVQRHHQAGGDRGDEAPARHRRRAGRRLSRPPRARLSGRLHPLAGAVAQAARAPARPAACSRWRCGSSATASSRSRSSSRANTGRWSRRWRPRAARRSRPAWSAPTARRSSGSTSAPAPRPTPSSRRWRRAALHGRHRRGQAGPAQSAPALHHLDPAAGGEPQARLRARPHHAASRSGSTRASTSAARPSASSPICAPTACRWRDEAITATRRLIGGDYGDRYVPDAPRRYQTKAKNAQEAHEAIRPTDLARRPRTSRATSSPTRPGSTS